MAAVITMRHSLKHLKGIIHLEKKIKSDQYDKGGRQRRETIALGVQVRLAGALDGCRRHGALEDVVELGAEASDDGLILADEAATCLALDGHLTEALLQLYRVPVSGVKLCLLLPQTVCCERHRCMHQRLALPLLGLL
ncbi:hypothetical protein GUJ93_ZPchr0003g17326 [Zizania palustris]|uniref:Uncharacterized protein n=1 Tax=Zizania palustris TaxID=103762 RepID=A0A8J5SB23_ZIZPA|nr:hypothetical protein GUJ93_ZPchr0003g17326 [Zizania palustris]